MSDRTESEFPSDILGDGPLREETRLVPPHSIIN